MNLSDLVRRFRVLANDQAQPYFWRDADIVDWLNDAEAQAAVRGRLLREDADPEVCTIVLTPGQHTVALHRKLYEIISIRLAPAGSGKSRTIELRSREWLDAQRPGWRDSSEQCCFATQNDTSLRIVGRVNVGDVLHLECYRLPLEPLALPDSAAPSDPVHDTPEIHESHHEHLILWALHKAFSIPDTETIDPQRSDRAEAGFTAYFGPMPDSDLRRITREDQQHHVEAFWP